MGLLGCRNNERDKYRTKGSYVALSGAVAAVRVGANGEVGCWQRHVPPLPVMLRQLRADAPHPLTPHLRSRTQCP